MLELESRVEVAKSEQVSRGLGSADAGGPSSHPCSRRLFTVCPSTKVYFRHLGDQPNEGAAC